MRTYSLENEYIKIEINAIGAELKSAFDKKYKKELLFDGNPTFWNRTAPVLFPFVGKLKNNSYTYKGETFNLPQHGFARDQEFTLVVQVKNKLIFELKHNPETLKNFPFEFKLIISYSLEASKVTTHYAVENIGNENLLFSIGAHPGFSFNLNEDNNFENYYLEFNRTENFERHLINQQTGNFSGETQKVEVTNNSLPLSYSLFEKDALVLKQIQSTEINIKHKSEPNYLAFEFENFPYFGIWTKKDAPFICLEPWCGLADSDDSTGELEKKEGIMTLNPQSTFERQFSFQLKSE